MRAVLAALGFHYLELRTFDAHTGTLALTQHVPGLLSPEVPELTDDGVTVAGTVDWPRCLLVGPPMLVGRRCDRGRQDTEETTQAQEAEAAEARRVAGPTVRCEVSGGGSAGHPRSGTPAGLDRSTEALGAAARI